METGKEAGKTNLYQLNKERFSLKKVVATCLPPSHETTTPSSPDDYPLVATCLHKNIIKDTMKEKEKIQTATIKTSSVKSILEAGKTKAKNVSPKATINAMILAYKNFIHTEFDVPPIVKETDKAFFYAFKKKMPVEINCTEQLMFCLNNWADFKYHVFVLLGESPKGTVPHMAFIAKYAEYIQGFKESIDVTLEKEKLGFQTNESEESSDFIETPSAKKKKAKKEALAAEIQGGKYG